MHSSVFLVLNRVFIRAHQLDVSNMFPALSLLVESPQWLSEGRSLSLHSDESLTPVVRGFTSGYKLYQDLDQFGIFGSEVALVLICL